MRFATHLAALRATQAIASVASVASVACQPPPPPATGAVVTAPTAVTSPTPTPRRSCGAVLDAELSADDPYPGKEQAVSPAARRCCESMLSDYAAVLSGTPSDAGSAAEGFGTMHRWACCANVEAHGARFGEACTPWGPPVPPSIAWPVTRPSFGRPP